MKAFFKFFFASLLALIVFTAIGVFIFIRFIDHTLEPEKPGVEKKTVLLLDLSKPLLEQTIEQGYSFPGGQTPAVNGLFDVVRAISYAKKDSSVKGIYLKCAENPNGFATCEELRNALTDFRKSKKFVFAYANNISQKAYYVATAADKIYCNPQGMLDWKGFAMQYTFLKGLLDKLEIHPEIFYAGQFKSATEPLREKQMTPANRLQSMTFLNELYSMFLKAVAWKTGVDTASLHQMANDYAIHSGMDALKNKFIDGLKYDDEIKDEIRQKTGLGMDDKIPFMPVADYVKAVDWSITDPENKISLIYAQGEIVDGNGDDDQIGGERYVGLIRKARLDKKVKAVVLRINSGGGSSMASEMIWRELSITRKIKPVVVSMGDYAASGGYYIACNADSIFAEPNTLTGSIGVFSVYGNVTGLMNNKLGITFDGVKTSPSADFGNPFRPMSDKERIIAQAGVDSVYMHFKTRVADGRRLGLEQVDSIAQGRIWSGQQGQRLGLVDRLGNISDAIDCAARMAKLKSFQLRESPIVESFWDKILKSKDNKPAVSAAIAESALGEDNSILLKQVRQVKGWFGKTQTRVPFFIQIR